MAPKKSALSSALAGDGEAAPAPAPPPAKKERLLDPAAFPCLEFAKEVDAGSGVTTHDAVEEEQFDVAHMEVVGSAPTSVLLKGVALVGRRGAARRAEQASCACAAGGVRSSRTCRAQQQQQPARVHAGCAHHRPRSAAA
eukprot:366101-Chlamydomonas_euryale.AAC.4